MLLESVLFGVWMALCTGIMMFVVGGDTFTWIAVQEPCVLAFSLSALTWWFLAKPYGPLSILNLLVIGAVVSAGSYFMVLFMPRLSDDHVFSSLAHTLKKLFLSFMSFDPWLLVAAACIATFLFASATYRHFRH